ncbi:MAG: hypothetical protein FOGNACKC_05357 [Anaerolineae bacterium]|nr:hypothetical protein [Anaerolineae bacterium]
MNTMFSEGGVQNYSFGLRKLDSTIWLVLALSVVAWAPLLTPAYFFNAHDARHSVFFLVEFDQTFRDGYLWPRWAPDFAFGYGYPLFNMYAPLAFYAAELLVLLGLGFTAAVKSVYVLATIAAGLGMVGFARRLFGPLAGLLAAVVYMVVPFHLLEIFVRSAYAEYVSLAVIPFVFWAFTELIAAPGRRRLALAGLAYGLLALTHHTSFFTFTPVLVVYILYLILGKSKLNVMALARYALFAAGAGLLGVLLAAIYLLPVLAETSYIKVEQWTSGSYSYLQHFVYFSQFFKEAWGYGYAGPGPVDDLSFQLGIVVFVLLAFALVVSIGRSYPHRYTAIFFFGATLVAVLLMSPLAGPVWQVIPIASLVQFPWRLLAVTAFTMSMVSAALVAGLNAGDHHPTGELSPALYLLALVMVLGSFGYTVPQYTDIPAWAETPLAVVNWDRASIVDRVGMVSVTAEQPQTSPMEAQYLAGQPLTTAGIIAGQGTVAMLHHGGASDRVKVTAQTPVTFQFYTYDYPGWQVWLDGQPLAHRYEPPHGLITVDLPAGEHEVDLRMGSTPPRTLGAILSGLALAAIIALLVAPKSVFRQN